MASLANPVVNAFFILIMLFIMKYKSKTYYIIIIMKRKHIFGKITEI